MVMVLENLNFLILVITAPLLVLVGILGYITPSGLKRISTEPAYNIFHIVCGLCAAIVLLSNNDDAVKTYNIVYGILNLYQFAASFARQFPFQYFKWTRTDNVIHLLAGSLLVAIALLGD